jgi:microcystin-dependent protein
MALPLITPTDIPTAVTSRCLVYPDSIEWRAIVNGLIGNAIDASDWQQLDGITPTEAAERCLQILQDFFLAGECDNVPANNIIGEIKIYTSETLPDGWLLCDGASYLIESYPELYAVIGDIWGLFSADEGYFYVPDLIRRFPFGANTGYPLGEINGEETHTLTESEMPFHDHAPLSPSAGFYTYSPGTGIGSAVAGTSYSRPAKTAGKGGGFPHNNLPPFQSVIYMIYAGL